MEHFITGVLSRKAKILESLPPTRLRGKNFQAFSRNSINLQSMHVTFMFNVKGADLKHNFCDVKLASIFSLTVFENQNQTKCF